MATYKVRRLYTISFEMEVEANNIEEAKQKVLKYHHKNAPNIVDKKYTEKCRNVSGMYEYGNLIERFKTFYQ